MAAVCVLVAMMATAPLNTTGLWIMIVGVVGALQLDVVVDRLKAEYGTEIGFETVPYSTARWIETDQQTLQKMLEGHRMSIANDRDDKPVFLFKNAWEIGHITEKFPDVKFRETREIVYEA